MGLNGLCCFTVKELGSMINILIITENLVSWLCMKILIFFVK